MRHTKLIEILSKLSPNEFRKFEKYVRSPYFNTHQDTLQFFLYIKTFYPEFEEADLEPCNIFKRVYPEEPFNDNKLRTLRKYLLKLLMRFIGHEAIEEDKNLMKKLQIQWFIKKRFHKYISKMFEAHKNELLAHSCENGQKYLRLYQLSNMELDFRITYGKRLESLDFSEINGALDNYYVTEKLGIYSCILSGHQIEWIDIEENATMKYLLSYCKEHMQELPLITTGYYHVILLHLAMHHNSASDVFYQQEYHFYKIWNITKRIKENTDSQSNLSHSDQANFYHILINYCIRQYKIGKVEYVQSLHDLYAEMIDEGLLFVNGILSAHHYKNLVSLGLKLKRYDWTQTFIEDYKDKLDPRFQETLYHFNLGHLYLYLKEYEKALQNLKHVDFIDVYYKLSYHVIHIMLYYEYNDTNSFFSQCVVFRTLLRRKEQLPDLEKKSYLNFTRLARALYMIKIQRRDNFDHVLEGIFEANNLTEKEWLIQKAEEIRVKP